MSAAGHADRLRGTHWRAVDDVAPEPWRNGGGQTRTLFTWPPQPADAAGGAASAAWQLRISVADIACDGPFSAFPGVQRGFAVLTGAGVVLQFAQRAVRLMPGSAPLHFDGADAPGCTLIDGPTRDLNLMLRGAEGGLQAAEPGTPWTAPAGAWTACFTTGGRIHWHRAADTADAAGHPAADSGWLDAPVAGLAVLAQTACAASPAGPATLRWSPTHASHPTARAFWIWAHLGPDRGARHTSHTSPP